MGDIAKVFMSGRSQAVRLPKKYRVNCDALEISRKGETLVLTPRKTKPWSNLLAALEGFDAARFTDCFPDGREQPDEAVRADLDDILDR